MPVKKNFNLVRFTTNFVAIMGDAVATHIVNEAVRRVRVDEGTLKNSIDKKKTSNGFVVETGALPYAAAQEWGLASKGKPKYRFTPYMRPAAWSLTDRVLMRKFVDSSQKAAILRSLI